MNSDPSRNDDRRLGRAQRDPTLTRTREDVGSREGLAKSTNGQPFLSLLFTWLSPAFPVGAFAYSHGLEMGVERGLLKGREGLQSWIAALIAHGSLHNDLLLVAEAHRATVSEDKARLAKVNELALALQPSAERYLETTQQGGSFLLAIEAAWPHQKIAAMNCFSGTVAYPVAYPVALGLAAAAHGISLHPTLEAFSFAFTSNLASAAIRLGIVGQTDAQITTALLAASLQATADAAVNGTLDDIFSATPSADLCSLEHETQYSRLFRS